MMKKIKYALLLLCFVLLSCGNAFLDVTNISCSIDKDSYKINEGIEISFYGDFLEDVGSGDLIIDLEIYKIENEEVDYMTDVSVDILDSGSLSNEARIISEKFYAYIYKKQKFTSFNDKIKISLSEKGDYLMNVSISGYTNKHPYGGSKEFNYKITVTE